MKSTATSKITRQILDEEGRQVDSALGHLHEFLQGEKHSSLSSPDKPIEACKNLNDLSPVPLARILDALPLFSVTMPRLTLGKSIQWLGETYNWELTVDPAESDEHLLAGLLVLSNGPGGFLFCNSDDPISRQRFSMAHEIGHFLLHADEIRKEQAQGSVLSMSFAPSEDLVDTEWETRERQANRFAAELLLPKGPVTTLFRLAFPESLDPHSTRIHLGRLHRFENLLAHRLLVSAEAVHFRLASLDLIPFIYRKFRPESGS